MPRPTCKPGKSILFTGGIGDVIAVTSFMSPEYRRSVKTVYWAAFRGNALRSLFNKLEGFEKARNVLLWDAWEGGRPFYNLDQVRGETGKPLEGVDDWSIEHVFPLVYQGTLTYQGCPWIASTLGTLPDGLPPRYVVIQGATSQNDSETRGERDLMTHEWRHVARELERLGLVGVVLDVEGPALPIEGPRLLDFRGLSLAQSIEVLKGPGCVGYWGIDSCLSVLATRRFQTPDCLRIRARNRHYYAWKYVYSAPYTFFPHLCQDLTFRA